MTKVNWRDPCRGGRKKEVTHSLSKVVQQLSLHLPEDTAEKKSLSLCFSSWCQSSQQRGQNCSGHDGQEEARCGWQDHALAVLLRPSRPCFFNRLFKFWVYHGTESQIRSEPLWPNSNYLTNTSASLPSRADRNQYLPSQPLTWHYSSPSYIYTHRFVFTESKILTTPSHSLMFSQIAGLSLIHTVPL